MSKALFSFLNASSTAEPEEHDHARTIEDSVAQESPHGEPEEQAKPQESQEEETTTVSPTWDDYPNLFVEAYYPTAVSAAIFSMASIRRAARQGIIDAPELDSLPLKMPVVFAAFDRHKETLKGKIRPDDYDFFDYCRTLDLSHISKETMKKATLHYFGDERETQECVYGISRNDANRMIMVCFRGSVTIQDWLKDSKVVVGAIKNPLALFRKDQPDELGVHLGFREYLYASNRNLSDREGGQTTTNAVSHHSKETLRELEKVNKNMFRVTQEMVRTTQNLVRANTYDMDAEGKEDKEESTHEKGGKSNGLSNGKDDDKEKEPETAKNGDDVVAKQEKNENNTPVSATNDATEGGNGRRNISKLHMVLEQLHNVMQQYPDYKVYITGHSLGGALSLLVALEAACILATKGRPITFVGAANPRAATTSFREAVEQLERDQKLRCLGVYNRFDVVPMIPSSWFSYRWLGSKGWYRSKFCEVGMRLTLEEARKPKTQVQRRRQQLSASFSKRDEYWIYYSCSPERCGHKWRRKMGRRLRVFCWEAYKVPERHHYMTYLTRLLELREPLSQLFLNDFYNEMVQPNLYPPPPTSKGKSTTTTDGTTDDPKPLGAGTQ